MFRYSGVFRCSGVPVFLVLVHAKVKGMPLVTIYNFFFLVELCPWRGGREVTKCYTGMLWPKVKGLSILQCFGQERLSMNE